MSKAFIDSKMATLQIFANQNYRLLEVAGCYARLLLVLREMTPLHIHDHPKWPPYGPWSPKMTLQCVHGHSKWPPSMSLVTENDPPMADMRPDTPPAHQLDWGQPVLWRVYSCEANPNLQIWNTKTQDLVSIPFQSIVETLQEKQTEHRRAAEIVWTTLIRWSSKDVKKTKISTILTTDHLTNWCTENWVKVKRGRRPRREPS